MAETNNYIQSYADLLIKVGLNLQPGQRLVVVAPVEAVDYVRCIATSAYKAGARFVEVIYQDDQVTLRRYQYAPRDSFEEYPTRFADTLLDYAQRGDALLRLHAEDPDLLKAQDPDLIATAQKTAAHHLRSFYRLQSGDALNWAVASIPQPAWAQRVFPDTPPEQAVDNLWQAIIRVCRLDQPDPIAAWQIHIRDLLARRKALNQKQYRELVFRAPGTNLSIGLPEHHIWQGGQGSTKSGIPFTPNLPTEEIFTLPHRLKVNGVVRATRPLSLRGNLVDKFSLEFKEGRLVDILEGDGIATLQRAINTDDGAAYLGEVALVPHHSPIAQSELIFYNTLFDENAACHLAFGRAYRFCLNNGSHLSNEDFLAAGGNDSLIHEDFMIGSAEMDIDGVTADGNIEPIMRAGDWAFDV